MRNWRAARPEIGRFRMATEPQAGVTQLLGAIVEGDARAASDLLPLVYDTLRALARSQLANEPPGHTLQPTALVHEAYLKLVGSGDLGWQGRRHFFGAAARAMRQILVDRARRHASLKRGGGRHAEPLHEETLVSEPPPMDFLALDEALKKLAQRDPRWSEIVELRYFAGLTLEETAAALGLSLTTVKDEWAYARAWLHREIKAGAAEASGG
jgi:RNA polymerase sigma factor (TIGR02999 family)